MATKDSEQNNLVAITQLFFSMQNLLVKLNNNNHENCKAFCKMLTLFLFSTKVVVRLVEIHSDSKI